MLSVIADETTGAELPWTWDGLAREGARRMLAAALEAEVDAYLAAFAGERDEGGRRLVVRNGHARQREILTAAGAIQVQAPRVDDRRVDPVTGQRARFRSVVCRRRREPQVAEVCRCCTCMGCPPATSWRRWRGSSAGGGAVSAGHHPAGRRLAGRPSGVSPA